MINTPLPRLLLLPDAHPSLDIILDGDPTLATGKDGIPNCTLPFLPPLLSHQTGSAVPLPITVVARATHQPVLACTGAHPTDRPNTLDDVKRPRRRDLQQIREPVAILPLHDDGAVQQRELDGHFAPVFGGGDQRAHLAFEDRAGQVQRHARQRKGAVVGGGLGAFAVAGELPDPGVEWVGRVAGVFGTKG